MSAWAWGRETIPAHFSRTLHEMHSSCAQGNRLMVIHREHHRSAPPIRGRATCAAPDRSAGTPVHGMASKCKSCWRDRSTPDPASGDVRRTRDSPPTGAALLAVTKGDRPPTAEVGAPGALVGSSGTTIGAGAARSRRDGRRFGLLPRRQRGRASQHNAPQRTRSTQCSSISAGG